jgi:hypothetical protein
MIAAAGARFVESGDDFNYRGCTRRQALLANRKKVLACEISREA